MKRSAITFLLCTLPLAAQNRGFHDNQTPEMECDEHNHDSARDRSCSIREQQISSTGSLQIDAGQNGGVTVRGWSRPNTLVRAKVEAWADSGSRGEAESIAAAVSLQAGGGEVKASGPENKGHRGWSVSYEVFVPHQTNVTARASNGGMHVSDVGGTLDLHTVNGGLHLARLTGDVRGETTNGGVHVELMGDRWDGRGMEVSSTNGGVRVNVPANYSARFEGSTVNGGVSSDIPELMTQGGSKPRHREAIQLLAATLGAGGPTVHITTVNGGLTINHGGDNEEE